MKESKWYTARVNVVEAMEQGLPWHEAAKHAGLEISQSTAYRLRQRMRQGGEQALREGRHGHPVKLRGEVRKFLEQTCRQAPSTPSHEIQTQLAQQFSHYDSEGLVKKELFLCDLHVKKAREQEMEVVEL